MDAFERAKRRYYNHEPMPQAAKYVKQLEARVAELEAELAKCERVRDFYYYEVFPEDRPVGYVHEEDDIEWNDEA